MSAVKRVVIVGRDAAAWMAALALQRAFAASGVAIEVVELPSLLASSDVYAAVPSLRGFHDIIGLDEAAVLTAARGIPTAGQRFSGWGPGGPFILGYDSPEPAGGFLPFAQIWAKANGEGMPVPFEEFSVGAMAARLGRVPAESDDASVLGATYGYHLDAANYAAFLKALAERRGVQLFSRPLADVEVEGDRVNAIVLGDGARVEADLFIDASGPEAVLLSLLDGDAFESWKQYLPCDRLLTIDGAAIAPLPGFGQVSAFEKGWVGAFPLQHRTAVIAAYVSDETSDAQVAERLAGIAPVALAGDAVIGDIRPGVRSRPWSGNCVGIGESAAALDPLDALQLHIAHIGISHLVNFWPVGPDMTLEAGEYNRLFRLHASNLRDFQAAHYKLNGRHGEPLWDRSRNAEAPESLERKLHLFRARADCPLYDEETFEANNWAALFLGHGLIPQSHDPRVDLIPEQEHIGQVQDRLRQIAAMVPTLPTVDSFLSATLIPVEVPPRT